jgi:uncharacterized membrane protein (UPF0127 family)
MYINIIKLLSKHTYNLVLLLLLGFLSNLASCLGQGQGQGQSKLESSSVSKITKNDVKTYTIEQLSKESLSAQLRTPKGQSIRLSLAISDQDQKQGLSGVKPDQFQLDQGMLFFNLHDDNRSFWMPDTHFDLHIFFLDKSLRVVAMEENVPHHPHKDKLHLVYSTKPYLCRHVLEMKSSSPIAQSIKVGDQLKWEASLTLEQIESNIRRQR